MLLLVEHLSILVIRLVLILRHHVLSVNDITLLKLIILDKLGLPKIILAILD